MAQSPDTQTLVAWLSAAGAWIVAVERRILGRPTRREIKEDLTEIKEHLRRQDEDAREHRDQVANSLHSLNLKVAVLQTRGGHPPSGDTGTHRKL